VFAFAFLWGLAEATLFFIVPDVLLSLLALRDRRRAWVACGYAVAGAVLGGALMYAWAVHDPAQVRSVLISIPAISPDLLDQVRAQLDAHGYASLFAGAFSGVPYKLYASEAGAAALPLAGLLIVTIPARALRFVLVVAVVNWIARRWLGGWTQNQRKAVLLAGWIVFYGGYFSVMARLN
jgi:membrane protein YqaA with SNARE-associated domain